MPVKKCFVPFCCNTSLNAPNKLFLTVPANRASREIWLATVGINRYKSLALYCCEDHFDLPNDIENWQYFKTMGTRILIKENVVPHLNLFNVTTTSEKQMSQFEQSSRKRKLEIMERLKATKMIYVEEDTEDLCAPISPFDPLENRTDSTYQTSSSHHSPQPSGSESDTSNRIKPIASDLSEDSSSIMSEPRSEASSSNQQSWEKIRRLQSTLILISSQSRFYFGLPQEVFKFVKLLESHCSGLAYRDVLITLKKIRLNDKYARLGWDFNERATHICRIFNSTVPILANMCQEMIVWPESLEIRRVLPVPFRVGYRNVQSIIDCFEVEIEKPTNPLRQSISWSEYKKCNTVKFLISSIPQGTINFVSGAFGGGISDEDIVTQSGFLDVLPENVHVMAARGFKHIGSTLALTKCTLIRPPSVIEGEQLSKEIAREAKSIAALRIYTERVIKRIQEFEFLKPHTCINNNILHLINHIVIIVCALINIQSSLIK